MIKVVQVDHGFGLVGVEVHVMDMDDELGMIGLDTDEAIELLMALAPLVGARVLDPTEAEDYEQNQRDVARDEGMFGPSQFPGSSRD